MYEESLDLTVEIRADHWAYIQRRLAYLESLLIRLLRDQEATQEWFTSAELVAMSLPGLPASKAAITRKARSASWIESTKLSEAGYVPAFHVTSLPAKTFDALVERVLDTPAGETLARPATIVADEPAGPRVTAPPWVLPLMRLYKGEADGDVGRAWACLPAHLPKGMACPTVEEAARVLTELGLAERIAR